MEKFKSVDYQQIRYHITYDENLTFKDLEDLLHIIRISNNDVLHGMGVPRPQANDMQRIEQIEPGSIEIIIEAFEKIMEVVNDVATVISATQFVRNSAAGIFDKIRKRRERLTRNPREDRKVYDKYEVIVEIEERPRSISENVTIYVIHIHVCNAGSVN